jgi:hypothetical protein
MDGTNTAPQRLFTNVLHRFKTRLKLLARHIHHGEKAGSFTILATHFSRVARVSDIQGRAKDRVFVVVNGQHFASRMTPVDPH